MASVQAGGWPAERPRPRRSRPQHFQAGGSLLTRVAEPEPAFFGSSGAGAGSGPSLKTTF